MSGALFDSNIVIDLLAGRAEAVAEVELYDDIAISIITWIEVMAGIDPARVGSFDAALNGFERIGVDAEVAERAAAIRRERRIKLPDAVIQATAETRSLLLITRNTRDFAPDMPGVRVPYRL